MEITPLLVNWALSILTAGVGGILSVCVMVFRLSQRLDDHESNCLLKHAGHGANISRLQDRVDRLIDE